MHEVRHPDFAPATLSQAQFAQLSRLIYQLAGINMPAAKKSLLESRLQKRLRLLNMAGFEEYVAYLSSASGIQDEHPHLIDALTTNKTDFFREQEHFDFLVNHALPQFLRNRRVHPLRVWSAGCSSGEEPFSIAMALREAAEQYGAFPFSILGTDISGRMLEQARLGIYEEEKVKDIPPLCRRKNFLWSKDRSRGLVRVAPEIRALVEFARLNLIRDEFAFGPFQYIFCRNVIIYFDKQTQGTVLRRLQGMLVPGGYLFLGHSETINGMDLSLVPVAPTIYRRPAEAGQEQSSYR